MSAMINLSIKDLTKEMSKAENEEKESQADRDGLITNSAARRKLDSKLFTEMVQKRQLRKKIWKCQMMKVT